MGSCATTTIGSCSGDNGTGDIEVDNGMLQTKWSLNSIQEEFSQCTSRPEIDIGGNYFNELVSICNADSSTCPDNIPIGCWDTSNNMSYV